MSLNVINDPWIPVRLKDGTATTIRPADFVDFGPKGDNPAVEFNAARPDFNGALIQFVIGLFQTFAAPSTEDEWWEIFESPPTPEELHEKISRFSEAFEVFGHPRFMQDFEDLPPKRSSDLFDLLLDSPGGNTKKNNKDIFNKRRESFPCCKRCATLAVFTMQLNAPGGGAGHRTSLRGGGPMTTILSVDSIWQTAWLNVRPLEEFDRFEIPTQSNLSTILPWMTETRTSEKGKPRTHPEDTHPAYIFWGTPRRINLPQPDEVEEGPCSICGTLHTELLTSFRMQNYGVDHKGSWVHPLTPYSFDTKNDPNPLKGKQEGLAYKYWQGIVASTEDDVRKPATVVQYFRKNRERDMALDHPDLQIRVWAFGYDADNAKIRSWQEGLMPIVAVEDADKRTKLEQLARQMIEGADDAQVRLRYALKQGLYGTVKEVTSTGKRKWNYDDRAGYDKSLFIQASTQFWRDTEADFYELLGHSPPILLDEQARDHLKRKWAESLKKSTVSIFDRITGYGNFHNSNPKSLALASNSLGWFFQLKNKGGIAKSLQLNLTESTEERND